MRSELLIDEPRLGRAAAGPALWVGLAAGAAAAVMQALVRHEAVPHGDDLIYERMADDPFGVHTFPFGYRIGVPLVVHALPFAHRTSFVLLGLLCLGAAAGFLYALMRALELPAGASAVACVAFALCPGALVALLRNGRSVDPATLLVMCAAALFIVRRQPVALAVTLLLGAFVRESTLFMIPFAYAVWADRWLDRAALARVCLVAAPAVAAYLALRLAIPTVGRAQVVGYNESFLSGRVTVVRTALRDWRVELRRVFLTFGPLWLIAPFALRRMTYAQRGLVLVACCVASLTYALDWERVLLLAAPVVYPAAGFVLGRAQRLRIPVLAAWLAIAAGYAVYMDRTGVVHNIDGGSPPTYPVQ
ncbi:MAG TPA: hypothetical protein VE972_05915 [Conexibacter sp.]|nr:hypothetical protein [Conexibacter sp.]